MTQQQRAMGVAGALVLGCLCAAIVLAPASTPPVSPPAPVRAPSLTGILTIATAVAAIVQALVAAIMVRGLDHAREAAKSAAETLVEAQKANHMSLRAYVGFNQQELVRFEVGELMRARVVAKNFGATPAKNCRVFVVIALFPAGEDPPYDAAIPPGAWSDMGMLMPGGDKTARPYRLAPVTAAEHASVLAGDLDIHLWGRVEYETFGKTERSEFRLWNKSREPGEVGYLHICAAGNGAT